MPLIKAKQIDIRTVAVELTNVFNDSANETLRNNFVNSIKASPGFDEKVKADANDDTPADYLSQKIAGSTSPGIILQTTYDNTIKKVKISGSIDADSIATIVGTKFRTIFFEATEETTTYNDIDLINKNILYVVREHSFLYRGSDADDYEYDNTTGTITFNSAVFPGERISILVI